MRVENHRSDGFIAGRSTVVAVRNGHLKVDIKHVCQLNCATGPLSGHFERSNKHACECWSDG